MKPQLNGVDGLCEGRREHHSKISLDSLREANVFIAEKGRTLGKVLL